MKRIVITMLTMIFCIEGLQAQVPMGVSYEAARQAPDMQCVCPEIEKYQSLFNSIRNEDYKIYADKIKENIELYTDPSSPANKYLVTQAVLNIENPLFSTENLLNYISNWIKKNKGWEKAKVDLDKDNKKIVSSATIHVASHSTFLDVYKVSVTPNLVILLMEGNQLLVSFLTDSYKNDVYDSHNKYSRTYREKISDVYPFVPKSSYKITYAKAYVGTYLYFWDFISNLYNDLNANYSRDAKMLAQLHYDYSKDSLVAMYGEPTKVIADQKTCPDVNNEIHFYEKAQKVVFMGKTIDFKDIISCEIVDDPQFIPGRSTTLGAGISFFGFGFGGAETYRTPDKTCVALEDRCMNEWVDISDITPSFLSCKMHIINKTMAFKVETEQYVYSFVEDDWKKVMEILNYVSWKMRRGDEYIINEWLENLIPQLGMDYVILTKSTQERNEPAEMQNTEDLYDVLDNMEISVIETKDFSKENKEPNNTYTPKQTPVKESQKANEKDDDRTGLLGGLFGVIIIYMVIKGFFKIFGPSKKTKKNDSWLDAAWFHDHHQSI